jgi:lipopolysaccharide/colanic/teichoic acid biosynthesis glycosyltransferase
MTIPLVAIANLFGNRGPVFYRQQRVGKSRKVFTMWKFRTMRELPGGSTPWTADDDPRITRVGGLLRSMHLDELPQVMNVLKGDLSIVGPRPEQPAYVEELVDKIPFYDLRHLVRPGLTGWRQVKFGYAGSHAEALEGLQFDFFYLRRQGLVFDLRIMGRTLRSVVRRQGR